MNRRSSLVILGALTLLLLLLFTFTVHSYAARPSGQFEWASPNSTPVPPETGGLQPDLSGTQSSPTGDWLTTVLTPTETITNSNGTGSDAFLPIVFDPVMTPTPTPTPSETPPPPANLPRVLYCSGLPGPIPVPDGDPAGELSYIEIDDPRWIADLDIYINLEHSWVGDLELTLAHRDSNTSKTMIQRPASPDKDSGCGGDDIIAILDDEASLPVGSRCAGSSPTMSGSYLPYESLAAFDGESINGIWTLALIDHTSPDAGSLNDWCLEVTLSEEAINPTPTPTPVAVPAEASIGSISGLPQSMPLDCESRSAVDWAGYFGVYINEFEFFNRLPGSDNPDAGFVGDVFGRWGQIPPDPYGVHAAPIAEQLRGYGIDAYAHRFLTFDDLRLEVASGRPAIVWVIGKSDGLLPGTFFPVYYTASDGHTTVVSRYEHTVIFTGYDQDQVTLLDGSRIYNRSIEQFLASWSLLRNMAVLARP
ncbi:MAG: hypothetical protein EHM70_00535 [Chloroflexota bacterium]|nr:MAG: hypothetical protein EHM70_00535 [Chloroflexota bacterium]